MHRTILGALCVAVASLLVACSAVLGIGDWVGLTDGGSGGPTGDASADARGEGGSHKDGAIDAGSSIVTVTPSTLLFGAADDGGKRGFVPCGASPGRQTFTVKNNGKGNVTWWPAFGLGGGSPYSLNVGCSEQSPCSLQPGDHVLVTVTGPAVPATAGIKTFDDTVTVFSSAPNDLGSVVTLKESSYGSILKLSQMDQNWGQVPYTLTASQGIEVLNSGNAPATVTLTLADGGSSELTTFIPDAGASSLNVPAGGKGTFDVDFSPNRSVTPVSSGVSLQANNTCAPLPGELTLEGQGTPSLIEVTSSLDFNAAVDGGTEGIGVPCGSTGPTLDVVVKNTGTVSANITALSLGADGGSPYYTIMAPGVLPYTVPAMGTATIEVIPQPIPASSPPGANRNGVLTVTTDATGDMPHNVALIQTSAGAVLSLAPSMVAFNPTVVHETASYPLTVTNTGNVGASIAFSLTAGSGPFTFDQNVVAAPNAGTYPNAYFKPTSTGMYSATGMLTASGAPFCSGFSGSSTFSLSGSGTTGILYGVSPSTVALGGNICASQGGPGTPPAEQTVTISNASNSPAQWMASLGGASPSLFTLSAMSGNVPAATSTPATVQLTVGAKPLSSSSNLTRSRAISALPSPSPSAAIRSRFPSPRRPSAHSRAGPPVRSR